MNWLCLTGTVLIFIISLYFTFSVVTITTNHSPVTNKFGFSKRLLFVFAGYNCSWNVTTRWELIFHSCLLLRGRNVLYELPRSTQHAQAGSKHVCLTIRDLVCNSNEYFCVICGIFARLFNRWLVVNVADRWWVRRVVYAFLITLGCCAL